MTAVSTTGRPPAPAARLPEGSVVIPPPQRPDIQRELMARAAAASSTWARLARMRLSGQEIDRGHHTDHANAGVLRRILGEHDWPGVCPWSVTTGRQPPFRSRSTPMATWSCTGRLPA